MPWKRQLLAPVLAGALVVLTTGCGGGPQAYSDLAYGESSGAQVLDLWHPLEKAGPLPVLIYVHGGAFSGGDKRMDKRKLQPLLDAGFAVASVHYRLSGEATFPAAAQDVKTAVRWLRANAAEYGLDPDRFAAWGDSAGGHLVALLGTTGDQSTVLDDPGSAGADVSGAVQAVVDWYGPTDFLQMDTQADAGGCEDPIQHDSALSAESKYLGAPIQSVPELAAQSDPITYIPTAGELPPFSIAHGDADCIVPYQQSLILADALRSAGAAPELTILPGVGHSDDEFRSLVEPTIAWLLTVLGDT